MWTSAISSLYRYLTETIVLFLSPIICILRLTAVPALLLLLLIRNPWIGGCHGFLGHMRGFPVARSSRRCLDQKSRAIFTQEKERIRCGWIADWVT